MVSKKFSLENKRILITGASSGIGRQTAIEASSLGAKLIITGRNKERLQETLSLCKKGNHKAIIADLEKQDQIKEFIYQVDTKLDGIVHSAGAVNFLPAKFINENNIYEMMDINYKSAVLLNSFLLRKKRFNEKASMVFISSIASAFPVYGGGLYAVSKAALEAYSRTLAIEIAKKKMRSNCLLPTFVETKLLDNTKETVSANSIERLKQLLPLGIGYPIDVANTCIFLLSDESRWITGQNIKMGVISF